MIAEVFIDLEKVFNGLCNIKQAKCVRNFYDWLNSSQQEKFMNWLRKTHYFSGGMKCTISNCYLYNKNNTFLCFYKNFL